MANGPPPRPTRWDILCEKYEQHRRRGGEDEFRLGRFAIHLRAAFATACECHPSYIYHYYYEHGHEPKYDKFDWVKTGWDSISRSEAHWVFALGVWLEIDPNTYPKTIAVIPFEIDIGPEHFDVKCSLFPGKEHIITNQPEYDRDLKHMGERLYEGLVQALDSNNDLSSKIGFTQITS